MAEVASPINITTMFKSSNTGPIRSVKTPRKNREVIIVTRPSTHLGMMKGVAIQKIM